MVKNFPSILAIICIWTSWLSPLKAQPYELRPKYVKGQILTFSDEQTITVHSEQYAGVQQEMVMTYSYQQRIDEVYPDGSVDLTLTILSSESESSEGEPRHMDYRHLIGQPLKVKLDQQLSVASVAPAADLSDQALDDLQRFKQFYLNASPANYNPENAVNVGDSWQNDTTVSFEIGGMVMDQIQKQTSKLEKVADHRGQPALEISFVGELEGTIGQGMGGSVSGSFSGKRIVAKETGQEVSMELTAEQNMERMTERGDINFTIQVRHVHKLINEESSSVR